MTYTLYIADQMFSSWSLRGWLMLEKFGLAYRTRHVGLYAGTMAADLAHLAPAKTVPVLETPDADVLTDSLAMAETLVERHPDLPLYPTDMSARALARSIVAEMHSSFVALRARCPMQLSHCWDGFSVSPAVQTDLDRITDLWTLARDRHGATGPWLFGAYTLADVFYAPVAMRIIGYGLPVSDAAMEYVMAHADDPAIKKWRVEALKTTYDPWPYPQDLPQKPWPTHADPSAY